MVNNNELLNELNDVKQQLQQLQQRKQQSTVNLQQRVNNNKLYQLVVNTYKHDKTIEFKPCSNEFNKVFVKHNGNNIMFLLVKLNDTVTFYTKHSINDKTIQGNTYPKQFIHRTVLNVNEVNENLLNDILKQSIENKGNKTTVNSGTTIDELTKRIELLTQQLNEVQQPTKKVVNKK